MTELSENNNLVVRMDAAGCIDSIRDTKGDQVATLGPPEGYYKGQQWWFGDPCYVLGGNSDDLWRHLCHRVFCTKDQFGRDVNNGTLKIGDWEIPWTGTEHGDGVYPVLNGFGGIIGAVGVDSGMVCAIPWGFLLEYAPEWAENHARDLGVVTADVVGGLLEFDGHNLKVGNHTIVTGGELLREFEGEDYEEHDDCEDEEYEDCEDEDDED